GMSPAAALRATANLAAYFVLTVVAFILHSRFTIGEWFVKSGFFVTDPHTLGQPLASFLLVANGIRHLVSDPLVALSLAGVLYVAVRGLRSADRSPDLLVLALTAFLVLPTYAFFEGHPFRMRYMIASV